MCRGSSKEFKERPWESLCTREEKAGLGRCYELEEDYGSPEANGVRPKVRGNRGFVAGIGGKGQKTYKQPGLVQRVRFFHGYLLSRGQGSFERPIGKCSHEGV